MLIEGSISSKKTQMLVEEYARLLNSGVPSTDILVLVNNSTAKENFVNKMTNFWKMSVKRIFLKKFL